MKSMVVEWDKNFSPEVILGQFRDHGVAGSGGKISYKGFDLTLWENTLRQSIKMNIDIEESLLDSSIRRSVHDLLLNPSWNKDDFLKSVKRHLKLQTEKEKKKRFVLLTSISIPKNLLPARIKINNSYINFYKNSYPRKFTSQRLKLETPTQEDLNLTNEYTKLGVHVEATSTNEAAKKALDTIDFYRAILCLQLNPNYEISFTFRTTPFNKIVLGNLHTLHEPEGSLATKDLWYDPKNYKALPLYSRSLDEDRLIKAVKLCIEKITKAPCKQQITSSLLKYVRALDENDPNNATLKCWSALESILAPNGENHEKLVDRCAKLYRTPIIEKQHLLSLKKYRNYATHRGDTGNNPPLFCYQAQRHLRALIFFLLENGILFQNISELCEFLDLPRDRNRLRRKITLQKTLLSNFLPK